MIATPKYECFLRCVGCLTEFFLINWWRFIGRGLRPHATLIWSCRCLLRFCFGTPHRQNQLLRLLFLADIFTMRLNKLKINYSQANACVRRGVTCVDVCYRHRRGIVSWWWWRAMTLEQSQIVKGLSLLYRGANIIHAVGFMRLLWNCSRWVFNSVLSFRSVSHLKAASRLHGAMIFVAYYINEGNRYYYSISYVPIISYVLHRLQ